MLAVWLYLKTQFLVTLAQTAPSDFHMLLFHRVIYSYDTYNKSAFLFLRTEHTKSGYCTEYTLKDESTGHQSLSLLRCPEL